jgi:hypothetical protein
MFLKKKSLLFNPMFLCFIIIFFLNLNRHILSGNPERLCLIRNSDFIDSVFQQYLWITDSFTVHYLRLRGAGGKVGGGLRKKHKRKWEL